MFFKLSCTVFLSLLLSCSFNVLFGSWFCWNLLYPKPAANETPLVLLKNISRSILWGRGWNSWAIANMICFREGLWSDTRGPILVREGKRWLHLQRESTGHLSLSPFHWVNPRLLKVFQSACFLTVLCWGKHFDWLFSTPDYFTSVFKRSSQCECILY